MQNIMIDVETLSLSPNAVVLSIGAVEFDQGIGRQFYTNVSAESCVGLGLEMDVRTVMWWLEQDKLAQEKLVKGGVGLHDALTNLSNNFNWKNVKVWSNGADFDLPILENAFKVCGLEVPWKYYDRMCYRTLKNLVPKDVYRSFKIEPAVAHDALADATAQAITAIGILNWLHPDRDGSQQVRRA